MMSFFDPFLILVAFFFFGYGFYRHVTLWRIGMAENRTDNLGARIRSTLFQTVGQGRILREKYPGVMHLLIFYGFIIPFSIIILFQFFFSLPSPLGHIFSLLLDCIGFLGLIGIFMALIRRYVQKPARLENAPQDAIGLALILSILVFGFLVEGFRMGSTFSNASGWSPVGSLFAGIFSGLGFGNTFQSTMHGIAWRIHFLLVLGFFAYIPYSKLIHIIISPANIFLQSHETKGVIAVLGAFHHLGEITIFHD